MNPRLAGTAIRLGTRVGRGCSRRNAIAFVHVWRRFAIGLSPRRCLQTGHRRAIVQTVRYISEGDGRARLKGVVVRAGGVGCW